MYLLAVLRNFGKWFGMVLAAWVTKQFFIATILPWFQPTMERVSTASRSLHDWLVDLFRQFSAVFGGSTA